MNLVTPSAFSSTNVTAVWQQGGTILKHQIVIQKVLGLIRGQDKTLASCRPNIQGEYVSLMHFQLTHLLYYYATHFHCTGFSIPRHKLFFCNDQAQFLKF